MADMVAWGSRMLRVEGAQIVPPQNLSRKAAYKTEQVESEGQKPGTATVGPELGTISFDFLLDIGHGPDPQTECDAWIQDCESGENRPLYIGGRKIGHHNWQLRDVTVSEQRHVRQKLVRCKVAVNFVEYVRWAERKKAESASTSSGSSKKGGSSGKKKATPEDNVPAIAGSALGLSGAALRRQEFDQRTVTNTFSSRKKD